MDSNKPPFGFTVPQRGMFFGVMNPQEMVAYAAEADRCGAFGSVWVGDSLLAKPRPEAIGLLSAFAGVTQDVALGVGCMASFPVRDPLVFAYQWATLDNISAGRALLAVCTGIVKPGGASDHEGAPWGVVDRDRAPRMDEFIDVCRRLWSEEGVTFEGRFCSFDDVTVQPRPVQDPLPVYVASNPAPGRFAEQSLRRVAEKADGWMSSRGFADNWKSLRTYLVEQGRDPEAFPTVAYHNVNIQGTREDALAESARFLAEYYGPVFTDEVVAGWTAAGTPEQCAADIRGLMDAGAKHVTLRITSWDQRGQFDRLVDEVLPKV